jgi:WhiB family transcriptional regulator, redox-sensing transcriptional regulator
VRRYHQPAEPSREQSTPAPSDTSWDEYAACRNRDQEIFFPIGTTGAALQQVSEAKAICARCRVAADCLDEALHLGQNHGVWGGTTPEERRALLRRAGKARGTADRADTAITDEGGNR